MAVTESVKIVFEVDDKALVSTVQQLQAVGKVSQEDAAKFNALTAASKAAGASLEGASKGAEKFAVASKDVAKSTTEVAKSAAELKTVAPSLGAAGQSAEAAGDGFVSLKTRLREAKLELQQLEEQFGPFSAEANAARQRAGELADEFADLNRQVNLTNPEGKVQAFQKLGQGVVGAFSVATGALQAFGAENEEVQKIASKLQGALNIAQGIQSIVGLKEAYEDVKSVLGFTTAAQTALTTATTAGTVATEGAAVATRGFAAALTSTGIGAIVVALGALVGAMILLGDETDETSKKSAKLLEIEAERKRLAGDAVASARALAVARGELSDIDAKRAEQEERDNELIRQKSEELAKLQPKYEILRKELDTFLAAGYSAEDFFGARSDEARDVIQGYEAIQGQLDEIRKNAVNNALILNEDEKKANQDKNQQELEDTKRKLKEQKDAEAAAAEERKQAKLRALDEELAALAEAQRGALIGVDDELQRIAIADSFREQITAKQIERAKVAGESITLIEQKAANDQLQSFEDLFAAVEAARDNDVADAEKAAADKLAAEQRLLDGKKALLNQEEALALLLNQVTATDATDLAENNFKTQEEFLKKRIALEKEGSIEQQKLQAQLALLYKDYEEGKTDETAKGEAERAELRRKQIDQGFEIANAATDLLIEANQRQYEEELASLEDARERGVLTEEQYEARVKKIKQKAAEDQKKAQIFQATMSAAQSILNALTVQPATAVPAAVAFAAITSALNLAKVIATPIPKFKKGTLAVPGRDTGEDTVHAMLRPGEAVIPTEINREYAPIIRAIYRKEVSSKEMNEFIESRNRSERQDTSKHLSTKDISEFINSRKNISYEEFSEVMRSKNSHLVTTKTIDVEPILKFDQVSLDALFKRDIKVSRINSTINNTSAAAMPSINVKADVDTYALSRAMAKNKSMELSNPDIVAKALAQELSKLDNPRRR
jgi:hypothetical protein